MPIGVRTPDVPAHFGRLHPGHGFPPAIAMTAPAPPPMAISPRFTVRGQAGRQRIRSTILGVSRARLSPDIAGTAPAPLRKGEERRRPGGVGGAGEELLGIILPGEGTSPLPGPLPHGDSHQGPPHGEIRGGTGFWLAPPGPSRQPAPDRETGVSTASWNGFPPGIPTHCPRPRGAG